MKGLDIMNRKIISLILSITAVLCLCAGTMGAAKAPAPTGTYTVTINGKALELGKNAAYVKNGRLMVPVREVSEALGYTVFWDASQRAVTIENRTFTMTAFIVSDSYARASKQAVGMTAPQSYGAAPEIRNARSYIPVRAYALLGYTVTAAKCGADIELSDSAATQLPSPLTEYGTVEEAAKAVDFKVRVPAAFRDMTIESVNVVTGETLQIDYADGVCYRVSGATLRNELGSGDISGDYTEYARVSTVSVSGQSVTVKGDNAGIMLAVWGDDANSFSVSFEKAVNSDWVSAIVSSVGK